MAQRKEGSGRGRAGEGGVRRKQAETGVQGEDRAMKAPGRSRGGEAGTRSGRVRGGKSGRGEGGEDDNRGSRSRTSGRRPNLQKELRDFASARPQGWGHDDWLNFLSGLEERGHNINDRAAIGVALERERLDLALNEVKGVGPQRRKALVERYGTVWNLRNAEASEIAAAAGVSPNLADEIRSRMRDR